ncbi:phage tail sheath family protein [Chryseobacterium profundimaris]|uniref:Tail sheath protein C-terminal domain-containing protein n=1 Tax=Chryseobacterium profundimaris TaxID=1387275 RepID=A0ABY1NND5_9FLAO|nr:phage tail sheath C-terminal domain-containing protein [Chryseobacterium profundimaris]SMP13285.1 hypothetical protein SAMN06264346_102571 [Chryseobacterium profundimaris]
MQNPTTPGVSVEEISKLPHSVSLIDTAIPVFIGYTEFTPEEHTEPLSISSLMEYEKYFGKAKKESIQLRDKENKEIEIIAPDAQFLMYYSLQMYFANGGGPCQILSAGNYTAGIVELSALSTGLNKINNSEEPILIIFPDAVSLPETDFYTIYNQTIAKIESTAKNGFVIVDTYYGNSSIQSNNRNTIANLRENIVLTTHAAAYFPHITTILNYTFDETLTPIVHAGLQNEGQASAVFYAGEIAALGELKAQASAEILNQPVDALVLADLLSQAIAIAEEINETADETSGQPLDAKADLVHAIEEAKAVLEAIYDGTIDDFVIPDNLEAETPVFSGEFDALIDAILSVKDEAGAADGKILKSLESSNSALYNQIKKEISSLKVVLPPSSAIAGVYGRIDSTRGAWKAPANVSLNYVVSPTEKVSDHEQSDMNVNDAGSVNAIRTFTGKGTLVWGARTMDAREKTEDDEENIWKYINVRRYYDMIKLSISRALTDGNFINEPNISQTWLRAKAMIENFLHQQWIDGGLAGSNSKEAYHVEVSGDILKPKTMNVTVEIALVRPAEFIVLNFSHTL